MFEDDFVQLCEGVRRKNVWEIERVVDQCTICTKRNGEALISIQSPPYKPWPERELKDSRA
jgi:hypothetical protein